jgi:hypothetical protein
METGDIRTTQESSHVKITNEDSAHNFLWYLGYYCSLNSFYKAKLSTKLIILCENM